MKSAVMIGDSHSQLVFPALKKLLNMDVLDSVSKPGWGVKKFMNSFDLDSLPPADVYIVALGGNNHDMNMISYLSSVDAFLGKIAQKAGRIVWISPFQADNQPVEDRHVATFDFLEKGLPRDVKYIDVYTPSVSVPTKDNMQVHYSRSDYKYFAELITPLIQKFADLPKFMLKFSIAKATAFATFGFVGFTLSLLVGNARDGR
jgi:hypothetical protein